MEPGLFRQLHVKDVNEEELVVLDEDVDGFHADEDCDDFGC